MRGSGWLGLALSLYAGTACGAEAPRVVNDAQGRMLRTEPNPIIKDQLIIRDRDGRRAGTIEPNTVLKGELVVKDRDGRRVR